MWSDLFVNMRFIWSVVARCLIGNFTTSSYFDKDVKIKSYLRWIMLKFSTNNKLVLVFVSRKFNYSYEGTKTGTDKRYKFDINDRTEHHC